MRRHFMKTTRSKSPVPGQEEATKTPWEAILLLAVMVLGLLTLVLKALGLF